MGRVEDVNLEVFTVGELEELSARIAGELIGKRNAGKKELRVQMQKLAERVASGINLRCFGVL